MVKKVNIHKKFMEGIKSASKKVREAETPAPFAKQTASNPGFSKGTGFVNFGARVPVASKMSLPSPKLWGAIKSMGGKRLTN